MKQRGYKSQMECHICPIFVSAPSLTVSATKRNLGNIKGKFEGLLGGNSRMRTRTGPPLQDPLFEDQFFPPCSDKSLLEMKVKMKVNESTCILHLKNELKTNMKQFFLYTSLIIYFFSELNFLGDKQEG